jgi:hypothetical protein
VYQAKGFKEVEKKNARFFSSWFGFLWATLRGR